MPVFRYKAINKKGELVTGAIDAVSIVEVARHIEAMGLLPIEDAEIERMKAEAQANAEERSTCIRVRETKSTLAK